MCRFALLLLLLLANRAEPFSPAAGGPRTFRAITPSQQTKLQAFRFDSNYNVDPSYNRHAASDWWYNVRSLPKSKVLREVRNPVLSVGIWSFLVSIAYRCFSSHSNSILRAIAQHMSIPGTAHSFLVSALGLLLVFRTNSAYQRFYEGRRIWENILSVSRNLSRMVHLYRPEVGKERYGRILNLVSAYPYLLRAHIRPGCLCSKLNIPKEHRLKLTEHRYAPETRYEGQSLDTDYPMTKDCFVDKRNLPWRLFLPKSLPLIAGASNRPVWVCDRIAAIVSAIPYGPNFTSRERLSMLGMVDKLTNAVGECERIHQTAVPLNYARHSLRSLTVWLFTLPFALVKDLGLFTAPTVAVVAWLFFGVYQIGYSIEDPFQGSLRLSILCDTIRRNVVRTTAFDELHADLPMDDRPPTAPADDMLLDVPSSIRFENLTETVGASRNKPSRAPVATLPIDELGI